MKLAIIGCGWLGFPLAKFLVNKGNVVNGTTTSESKLAVLEAENINPFLWNLSLISEVEKIIEDVSVLIVNIPPRKSDGLETYSEALEILAKKVSTSTRVIFISTTGVYPEHLSFSTADCPFDKMDDSKETVLAEIKLRKQLGDNITIIRMAGLIGPNRHPIKSLSQKQNIPNGDAPLNLIHLNDAIGLIHKVIESNYWGKIINGCYPEHPSKSIYYQSAANHFGLTVPSFLTGGKDLKEVDASSDLDYIYTTSILDFNVDYL